MPDAGAQCPTEPDRFVHSFHVCRRRRCRRSDRAVVVDDMVPAATHRTLQCAHHTEKKPESNEENEKQEKKNKTQARRSIHPVARAAGRLAITRLAAGRPHERNDGDIDDNRKTTDDNGG